MAKFYISDLHLGHRNIIKHDDRPFRDTEEMDNEIINRWNNKVSEHDNVYIVGDVMFYRSELPKKYFPKMNGNKHLIKGNHDGWVKEYNSKQYFSSVSNLKTVRDNGFKIVLSHYPIHLFIGHNEERYVHLYGHVHMTKEFDAVLSMLDIGKYEYGSTGQMYNIGANVPYIDYTPRTLDEILNEANEFNTRYSLNKLVNNVG